MGYVENILQPNEKILARGKFHWIIYAEPALCLILGLACLAAIPFSRGDQLPLLAWGIASFVFLIVAAALGFRAWFNQWITEISVTNLRVIYKRGFIRRLTTEMNMDKIESVTIDQPILGRILGFGSIHVLGTGEGIEHIHRVGSPLQLRNAIVAR